MVRMFLLSVLSAIAIGNSGVNAKPPAAKPHQPTAGELAQIEQKMSSLQAALKRTKAKGVDDELLVDVEVYLKAAQWITRYASEEFHSARYVTDTLTVLDRGLARAEELAAGRASWPKQTGLLVRAYRSAVDGSAQPYGLAIPASYDGRRAVRLDLVLHGRGATLNEVSFIAAHEPAKPPAVEGDAIRLDVFGRTNNAYRWSGEADVFEALAAVEKRYKIDRRRIVLRGFSMGGAGAWHLGLHYPGRFAAVEAGAGFTETKRYAKLENLPAYQEALLHIYDAADYARNAWNVPYVGYAGEEDSQLQAMLNIRQELEREGVAFTRDGLNWLAARPPLRFLVGPQTGHKFHPESKRQSDQFLDAAARSVRAPDRLRFVTYTLRYHRCHWLTVEGLARHYERAEVEAQRSVDGREIELTTRNVTRLAIDDVPSGATLRVDGATLQPSEARGRPVRLAKHASGWRMAAEQPAGLRKSHGLQGPIDDAFSGPFVCVRPSGQAAHDLPGQYATSTLDTFTREFARWLRGDVPVKRDTEVTAADIAGRNLVLFGDRQSNRILGQIAARLPIRWEGAEIVVGARRFAAAEHAVALVYPNPLNPRRYVVVNSGHTFHEADFRGTNALLFPRLGDYAVFKLTRAATGQPEATVAVSGFFDEDWKLSRL